MSPLLIVLMCGAGWIAFWVTAGTMNPLRIRRRRYRKRLHRLGILIWLVFTISPLAVVVSPVLGLQSQLTRSLLAACVVTAGLLVIRGIGGFIQSCKRHEVHGHATSNGFFRTALSGLKRLLNIRQSPPKPPYESAYESPYELSHESPYQPHHQPAHQWPNANSTLQQREIEPTSGATDSTRLDFGSDAYSRPNIMVNANRRIESKRAIGRASTKQLTALSDPVEGEETTNDTVPKPLC